MSKGLSSVKTLTAREIAKKWELPLATVAKKIAAGVKVEKEHTKSTKQANEIARDHLGERPDYYDKLHNMEKQPVVKEESSTTTTSGMRGLGYYSGEPGGVIDQVEKYINTNSMSYVDENGNKLAWIKKNTSGHNAIGFDEFNPTELTKKAKLKESLGSDYGTSASPIVGDLTGTPRKVIPPEVKEDLRKWFREKWVRYDTKGNIKGPCAREEGEGKPKCRPLASARAMSKDERAKSAKRKRREDPVADRTGKGGKPIMVRTEETLMEKNVPTNPALWARAKAQARAKFDVYPSAYANGWASKWYKSKGGGWKTAANESIEEACWDTHKQEGMKKKGGKMVPNCVPKEEKNVVPANSTERGIYETKASRNPMKAMALRAALKNEPYDHEAADAERKKYPTAHLPKGRDWSEKMKARRIAADKASAERRNKEDINEVMRSDLNDLRLQWHLTDKPSFKLSKKKGPEDSEPPTPRTKIKRHLGTLQTVPAGHREGGARTKTSLQGWASSMPWKTYAVRMDVSKTKRKTFQRDVWQPEVLIKNPEKAKIKQKIYPIEKAIAIDKRYARMKNWRQDRDNPPPKEKITGRGWRRSDRRGKIWDVDNTEDRYDGNQTKYLLDPRKKDRSIYEPDEDTLKFRQQKIQHKLGKKGKELKGYPNLGRPNFSLKQSIKDTLGTHTKPGYLPEEMTRKDFDAAVEQEKKKNPKKIEEISAELVGKVSNARWRRGEAASPTLSRAINKKFIESGKKKEEDDTPFTGSHKRSHEKSSTHVHRLAVKAMKKYQKEETTMDTKDLINEALDSILEDNLVEMKENLMQALQEKAMEKLEERKKIIASDYFAQ